LAACWVGTKVEMKAERSVALWAHSWAEMMAEQLVEKRVE